DLRLLNRDCEFMAAKIRIMKLLQEIRGLADITQRQPTPRQPGLFLIELRSHLAESRQPWNRKTIVIEMQGPLDVPHPVKIRHIPAALPTSPRTSDTTQFTLAISQT